MAMKTKGTTSELQNEIDARRKEIHTDGYPMSIGEMISLYENDEIDIHPAFQRFFRWTAVQKSKLIESILLGIPIPPIFVSQRSDGVWDVVDGLQRLSTIFEFVGLLRDEDGNLMPPAQLVETEYLPALKAKTWAPAEAAEEDDPGCFTQAQRIAFKREKLDMRIIKKESDSSTKYELFQRLNTLGTSLSEQELRNCLLLMMNRELFDWLSESADYPPFQNCISLSDKQRDQRYDMELLLRFFAFKKSTDTELKGMVDVHDFLTDKMREFAENPKLLINKAEESAFENVFALLDAALGDDSFRRFDKGAKRFMGGFLVSGYEAISVGVGLNIGAWGSQKRPAAIAGVQVKVKALWNNATFTNYSGAGVRGTRRVPNLIKLGRLFFKP